MCPHRSRRPSKRPARAEAEAELARALAGQHKQHEDAVLAIREEAKPVEASGEPAKTAELAKEQGGHSGSRRSNLDRGRVCQSLRGRCRASQRDTGEDAPRG